MGLLQIIGFISNNKTIRSIGRITVASPLPIVFTEQKGIETFASDFYLVYKKGSNDFNIKLDPALYSKFNAPYNYRNVIGAAISYGPILPDYIVSNVLHFNFLNPGQLSKSIGIDLPIENAHILIKTKTKGRTNTWILPIN